MVRPRPVGDEVLILKTLGELGEADPIKIGRKIDRPTPHVEYLCRYMLGHGYLMRVGRRYRLSPSGAEEL